MDALKLIALDADDLAVLSAHLQDAILKVGDMAFLPKDRRFAIVCNRFDWRSAPATPRGDATPTRKRAGLRIERIVKAQVQGIDLAKRDAVLSLLAVQFVPAIEPAGVLTLTFAGQGAIRLEVECIEASLTDLGPAWAATAAPHHGDDGDTTRD